jgi:pyridoxal phosphate enzyme (YggS family)
VRFRAHIDGAARGNPGPAGARVFVEPEDGLPAEEHFEALGRQTNNVAEYRALLLALRRAQERGATEVAIASDSLLLVEQMRGRFRVKAPHLQPLFAEALVRAKTFPRFSIRHVRREQNVEADPARQSRGREPLNELSVALRARNESRPGGRAMNVVPVDAIARRRAAILENIARAAAVRRVGRDPSSVALMAVTKGQSAETVAHGVEAGLRLFGENRVQEAATKIEKIDLVRSDWPRLEWRLIGPLQTNKARTALQYFQVLESLDRERLATRLESLLAGENPARTWPVLLEVNVGGEPTKWGVTVQDAPRLLEAALGCPHLAVRGLMAVPPFDEDPEASRPHFRALARLRDGSARFGLPLRASMDEPTTRSPWRRAPRGPRRDSALRPRASAVNVGGHRRRARRRDPLRAPGASVDRDHRGAHSWVNSIRATRSSGSSTP